MIFTVYYLGFVARCALEIDDSGEVRILKIVRIIGQSAYGIHDISAVELSESSKLPRFNMPLELGMDLGCKHYGSKAQQKKRLLILDSERYRFQASISDIAGQDIHAHGNKPEQAIVEVRNWLTSASQSKGLPGGTAIVKAYEKFMTELPVICAGLKRKQKDLTFGDFSEAVTDWLESSR